MMSATMARQGGRVQLEQSDMCLACDMAKMARVGFSLATLGEMQCLTKKPRPEIPDEKKRGVEYPRHTMSRLRWNNTQLLFGIIKPTASFTAKMAEHRITRDAGGAKAWVHLHQSDSDSQLWTRRLICQECHLWHPVTITELTYS